MFSDASEFSGPAALQLQGVSKSYRSGNTSVPALRDVSLAVPAGTFTAIMGPSGSGKSTLLQCAAGLDAPDSGRVLLGTTEISKLHSKALTRFRRDHVGFVFQSYNLLPQLTVARNVTLPLLLAGRGTDKVWLDYVLEAVGLAGLGERKPQELSGGQQQRAAIARALITRPDAVFADEPTGALDSGTARQVLDLLRHTVSVLGQTVIMVTHDPVAAGHADTVIFLADGRLDGSMTGATAQDVSERMANLGER
ncbi:MULTISPECIES: ABC transporter ATP-binding protein [unclassified Arthrobacter]|uniref:ABC transporter ATP-binding protein n=1 Tax=unclassified Arthrobacter TaxID=235627 RepID=UPI001D141BB8|nr:MULTISPECIES: ABC transporter ATP-binding protein [unclassified Arthrobacter]MCC3292115.1 ABC transporter ATP-binding protein [Arthrobacter sp. zg-Y1110]MCC3302796.1 ABC transporter ATP-binding protein [Arthrobacter sp. zg-Y895]UWX85205.1 ABC transporter ATP-binding protein [Arthrobacter sp. zg-Y1110]